ncbi:LysM peptidoglycan-binding domain-containing protein [Marixanthomonas spongiae]|uniref:Peptidoglycan-binding protein LysM n=1 Tax=Marixanthomonas spongiae TaxID=2174845 RepID=A0A2U0HXD8_9FLAO|nr:LysM peptidoglycan-binding domain-containing protein [Marixanthomonas spongiae]PVW13507.1 peptidoglycan-binding protein LysM [Marixanthomonas spongiae]
MKHFIFLFIISFLNTGCGVATQQQQQYRSHRVTKGETVYSIAQQYDTTENAIYRLNPDAKNGIGANTIIILPRSSNVISSAGFSDVKFKMHRVKRRETLFSIAQQYNVTQEAIKKYNKELYSRQLKKGEKIRIPVSEKATVVTDPETTENTDTNTHTVAPKETIYGIARKYNTTIAELKKRNPGLDKNIAIGTVLTVPDVSTTASATIDNEKYDLYEVQPKEGFYRLKVKLGLSEEEIVALNPFAKDGLKDGMILKIPKENAVGVSEKATPVNLEHYISNRSVKNVAVLLPFQLREADSDSTAANTALLKSNSVLRIALDFYSGVLMATEFAKDKGISVNLKVFDTERSAPKVGSIVSGSGFNDIDAVIGPLLSKNVDKAAALLRGKNVPVFSPLSNKEIRMYPNLFQTLPSDEMLKTRMMDYLVEKAAGRNLIVISDAKHNGEKQRILSKIPTAKTVSPREGGYLYQRDIAAKVDAERENWVVLASSDPVLVSNVVGLLNGMPDTYYLRLLALEKNKAYDYHDVSNMHLANLQFTFPSVNKNYDFNEKDPFLISYKNKYGVLPNRYAVRGFDIMYDVLLRLASAEDMYQASENDFVTEYIENKFQYTNKLLSGYQNNAVYIVKYDENLHFKEAE